MQAPVFFIVGPVGHGKTTSREILCRLTHGQRGASCSDVIYKFLSIRKQVSEEDLRALPKEELRPQLIEAGDFLCGQIGTLQEVAKNAEIDQDVYRHPSALIRTLYMSGYNIIDGVRRRLELQDATTHLTWNGVRSVVIHVEDPRKAKIADNSEDLRDLADEHVVNDGTPGELEAKLAAFLHRTFGTQDKPGEAPPIQVLDAPAKPAPAVSEL